MIARDENGRLKALPEKATLHSFHAFASMSQSQAKVTLPKIPEGDDGGALGAEPERPVLQVQKDIV